MLFYVLAASFSRKRAKILDQSRRLFYIPWFDQEACLAVSDNLCCRAALIGDYGGAAGHCLDGSQAEWLFPFYWEEQATGLSHDLP